MGASGTRCSLLLVSDTSLRDAAIYALDFHPNVVDVFVRSGCLLDAFGFEDEGAICVLGHQAGALSNQGWSCLCTHDLLSAPRQSPVKFGIVCELTVAQRYFAKRISV